ncbi:uncharacterized protein LOC126970923 isoform X1 [Leptidea sinapis]|uniref:uncharacterized protein LOC126970923 isoform X1 n=1 Tax=Leptidea sinapis TaxID=189913 RepID=UPI00213DF1E6|nr:uncharacterized protein LOC126970923 isoform X1 [Leptidea sinapis]
MARLWQIAALCTLVCSVSSEPQSRFHSKRLKSRTADVPPGDTDEMIGQLLHWIQGLSQQRNRKARQYFGGKPERPRPFEPASSYLPPVTGYPESGSRPTPAYSEGPSPSIPPYQPSTPFQPSPEQPAQPPYPPSYQPSQPTNPPFQGSSSYQPSSPFQPNQPSQPSYETTYQPSQSYEPSRPSQPSPAPSYYPNQSSPSSQPSQPDYQTGQTSPNYSPSQPNYQTGQTSPSYNTNQPNYQTGQSSPTYQPTQPEIPEETSVPSYETPQQTQETESPQDNGGNSQPQPQQPIPDDDEDRHPPHIHSLTVDCGKEMMTINIEFNKPYNGIIYSQDHYKEPECVYVRENSNQIKYSFTVSLNTCGTRFFSDFENEGQAYLENVLVLQNEPGIQELWDHIRRVRCLWEGNLTKQLVSSLSVGMLNQITSNFSGDTAMARLDIQTGRGPFAPEANGLIKIGETMTLVVSVTGDPGFDILVRECIARDADNINVVPLTDSNGCVLKPKIFGAFQKTRDTGNTGASIIAYAYFNAFKFPDEMDLIIQCEVELCKTDCEVCPNPGSYDPKRKRRDIIHLGNRTLEPMTTVGKGLRVVFAEDLPNIPDYCVSPTSAMWGGILIMIISLLSSLSVMVCWQRTRDSIKFL